MAVEITAVYTGHLHTTATHGPSRSTLHTDAPLDNGGTGEAFSPTDLCATSLATCMLTTMAIFAKRVNLDVDGARVRIEKHMVADPLRRISALPAVITFPAEKARKLSPEDRKKLENSALTCPVHKSLHPNVNAPVTFVYEGD